MNITVEDIALVAAGVNRSPNELLVALTDFREGQYERLKEFGVRVRNSAAKPSVVCDYRKQSFRVRQDDSLGLVREMLKIYSPAHLPTVGKFAPVFELAPAKEKTDAALVAYEQQNRASGPPRYNLTSARLAARKLLQLAHAYGPEGALALDMIANCIGAGVDPILWDKLTRPQ